MKRRSLKWLLHFLIHFFVMNALFVYSLEIIHSYSFESVMKIGKSGERADFDRFRRGFYGAFPVEKPVECVNNFQQ